MLISGEIDAVWMGCRISPGSTPCARSSSGDVALGQARRRRLRKTSRAHARGSARDAPPRRRRQAPDGYLENQVFSSAVQRGKDIVWRRAVPACGRPYLARAAEEHSGPHMPWFWQGRRQGGGVLSDMTCHSVEVGRFLLTKPGAPRSDLTLVSASATVGNLKWTRPEYVKRLKDMMGPEVDYASQPAEDFARGALTFSTRAATESWSRRPILGPMSALACAS